ncbi:MAG: hypothetical protein NVSMB46_09790 [Candidatus Saccharimonadales bacterium]
MDTKDKKTNQIGKLVGIGVISLFLGFGVIYFISRKDAKPKVSTSNNITSNCAVTCIALQSDHANPDTVAIKVGEFVQFNSADGMKHEIVEGSAHSSSNNPIDSGEFGADEAWKVQFKQPGTFQFIDKKHPGVNILIVVYQPGGDHTIR